MSQQYPGGLITKNPVVPSGPYENSSASGVWTMDQAAQYIKAGNWPTSGNVDPSAFIENLFSTYLYTGNGSTQTITNGIDLSGKGGLVWMKGRSGATDHALYDTVRGATKDLVSNSIAAETTQATGLTAFSGTGFSIGALAKLNTNAATYASWTFRKQAKFFDVVTYTGDGVAGRTVAHNLGSVPGCIIVKRVTVTTSNWAVYHRSLSNTEYVFLNTNAASGASPLWNNTTATDSVFTVGSSSTVNANGGVYIAYIFAHNAGGFGLSGTDNVISCGSYTGNGSTTGPTVTLGYEPQWVLIKDTTTNNDWQLLDSMRGLVVGGADAELNPNNNDAESSGTFVSPLATGFRINTTAANYNANGSTYIYIAIRRGPMKVPTSGTSVFQPFTYNNSAGGFAQTKNAGFATDFAFESDRTTSANHYLVSRLQGPRAQMASNSTLDEASYNTGGDQQKFDLQNLFAQQNSIDTSALLYCFRRAPGFMDVVCYTGTGVSGLQIAHNLTTVPELMLVKRRNGIDSWFVYAAPLGNTKRLVLDSTAAASVLAAAWNNTTPTATQFTVGNNSEVNGAGSTYVNYLFATVAGVSKVGSYTGSGTTKQVDCGFTGGARFVLIKRTNSTGDWYVWDSARGIVAGNDPYLLLNSTAAEVTSTDYVDTYSAGFELSSTAPAGLNANGGTYIFLAIA